MADKRDKKATLLDEEEIVRLYLSRDETAIRMTELKYNSSLRRIAWRMLQNEQDVEEVLNDTYLRVWQTIPPNHPDNFGGYVTAILKNVTMSRVRESRSQRRIPQRLILSTAHLEGEIPLEDRLDSEIIKEEFRETVSEFVRQLPDKWRFVFIGHYYMGRPIAELARELGMSRSRVHEKNAEMIRDLREFLKERGYLE